MKKIITAFYVSALLVPVITFAAGDGLKELIRLVGDVLGMLIPITVTLALLYFIWGLAMFIKDSGSPEKKDEGKTKMIWGIIALFVIVSIWGLVDFIGRNLGINQNTTITTPQVPGVTSGPGGGRTSGQPCPAPFPSGSIIGRDC